MHTRRAHLARIIVRSGLSESMRAWPRSCVAATRTAHCRARPSLALADPEGDDNEIPLVTPLRATGLKMLEGRTVCAVVYDSDISINYGPLNGSLKGANLGTVAFHVRSVTRLTGFSSSSLPKVELEIRDANEVCNGPLTLFTDAPEPSTSSTPFDIVP